MTKYSSQDFILIPTTTHHSFTVVSLKGPQEAEIAWNDFDLISRKHILLKLLFRTYQLTQNIRLQFMSEQKELRMREEKTEHGEPEPDFSFQD